MVLNLTAREFVQLVEQIEPHNDLLTIGDRIRHYRNERGWSISWLAKRADVGKGYLSELERKPGAGISVAVLSRIAEALDVPIIDLLENKPTSSVPWWQEHPAYEPLVSMLRGHTQIPHHLAYVVLTGCEARGLTISGREQDNPSADLDPPRNQSRAT